MGWREWGKYIPTKNNHLISNMHYFSFYLMIIIIIYFFFFFQKINLFVFPQWRQFVCMNCQIVLGAKSFPFSEGTANKNSHKVVSLVKMSETESTKCTLYPCHATPPSNFQPIRLLDPGCRHKFTYLMTNRVDPDQMASSEAN